MEPDIVLAFWGTDCPNIPMSCGAPTKVLTGSVVVDDIEILALVILPGASSKL